MERFENIKKGQNKAEALVNESNESMESNGEKAIEAIQIEEKEFLGEVKESTRGVFHCASKEKFQQAFRAIALATVLLIPVGEKTFAERSKNIKEPTVTMAQIGQESGRLGYKQEESSEKTNVAEQKELLKEKYEQGIILGGDFSFEELKDLDGALETVCDFAPKKFNELKLIFLKHNLKIAKEDFWALTNVISDAKELQEIRDKSRNKIDYITKLGQHSNIYATNPSKKNNYEMIFLPNKKDMNYDETRESLKCFWRVSISNRESFINSYRDTIIHELGHIISKNDAVHYKKMEDEFTKLNNKAANGKTILEALEEARHSELKRPSGCVSAYAATTWDVERKISSGKGTEKAKYDNSESIAEVFSYMALGFNYADDDPIVQEKIEVLKNFLNKKSNE